MRGVLRWFSLVLLLVLAMAGARVAWEFKAEPLADAPTAGEAPGVEQRSRGEYLARAGNCAGCHSASGGAAYAGGPGIATPFGTVYATNLTPDATGLGGWSAPEFWRAMHHGRSRDGRLLYPVFPYPNMTRITRADSDALFAWLQSLPPMAQANRPHELRFPYDTQLAVAAWRALYFRAGEQPLEPARSAEWNRGAYLVQALSHCNACHGKRNVLGATTGADFGGGLIPLQNWYAPALTAAQEAGVADWPADHIVALLKTGVSPRGSAIGPMAEVVLASTQYLADADLRAMAAYLQALPQPAGAPLEAPPRAGALAPGVLDRGAKLYADHCAACHGEQGEGAPGAYPALAGNRAVTLASPVNLVRVLLAGGFAPATAGNPRPYGMPPFANTLGDEDLAAIATYVRNAWGHAASPLNATDVNRLRGAGL